MRNETWYYDTFLPMVEEVIKRKEGRALYYEVYIDLEEGIDRWYEYASKWTNLAIECLSNWAIRRDKWYWSPSYVKALDKAVEEHKGDYSSAFSSIL